MRLVVLVILISCKRQGVKVSQDRWEMWASLVSQERQGMQVSLVSLEAQGIQASLVRLGLWVVQASLNPVWVPWRKRNLRPLLRSRW